MRQQKHQMGVEVPSFFEYQRRKAEQEAASAADKAKAKKQGFFDALFAPEHRKPEPPPAPGPSTVRPGFLNAPGYIDANQWFEVGKIWNQIASTILKFGNQDFVVDVLTRPIYNATRAERDFQSAAEIAQFFGIPASEFQGLTLEQSWQNVIGPFFEALEHSINRVKPFGILGSIRFELEPSTGELLMAYRNQ